MESDFCVTCGRIIPEGRMVCPLCEWSSRIRWTERVEKYGKICPLCKHYVTNNFGHPINILQSGKNLYCMDCATHGVDVKVGEIV